MLIRELSRTQSLELLQRGHLGRLACALDGQPYVVPVQYSFDPEKRCLYCFSAIGQKIEWMRRNPLVCVEVDEIEDKDHWSSVVVYGRYEEINSDDKDAVARQRAQELFQRRPEWWLPGAAKLPTREPHAVVLYRVQIDRITGRGASRSTLG